LIADLLEAQRKVNILTIGEEAVVKWAYGLQSGHPDEECTTGRKRHLSPLIELPLVSLFAATGYRDPRPKTEVAASEPKVVRRIKEIDLRICHPNRVVMLQSRQHFGDAVGSDHGIVVEEQYILRACYNRLLHTEVTASRESNVLGKAHDGYSRMQLAYCWRRILCRTVIDN